MWWAAFCCVVGLVCCVVGCVVLCGGFGVTAVRYEVGGGYGLWGFRRA